MLYKGIEIVEYTKFDKRHLRFYKEGIQIGGWGDYKGESQEEIERVIDFIIAKPDEGTI